MILLKRCIPFAMGFVGSSLVEILVYCRTTICTGDCYITSDPTHNFLGEYVSARLHVILGEGLVTRYCWHGYYYSRYLPYLQLSMNLFGTRCNSILLLFCDVHFG